MTVAELQAVLSKLPANEKVYTILNGEPIEFLQISRVVAEQGNAEREKKEVPYVSIYVGN